MYGRITDFVGKIKRLIKGDIYLVLLILFLGFASFGLGRLSVLEEERQAPYIHKPLSPAAQEAGAASVIPAQIEGQYVASKNGSKYHFPWCSGAERIKEENKVWFASKEVAEQAGYTPAANCKGL